MLCKDKITTIFCIIDDILIEINPPKDTLRKVSDREIIITAFIATTKIEAMRKVCQLIFIGLKFS
ncbi:MAG: hypothetical protein Q3983_08015 [Capnocytophaga sp.]|nr:hypothetical protein [Capnocytophaga sp.]